MSDRAESARERVDDLAHEAVRYLSEQPTDVQETRAIEMMEGTECEGLYVGDTPWMVNTLAEWIENNRDRILAALSSEEGERGPVLSCVLGRVGGELCYHGTRVPVHIVGAIEEAHGLDYAHEAYPHIPKERMEVGLRLYRERILTPPESPERGEGEDHYETLEHARALNTEGEDE